jgi:release factor glutamine methyltransferase
MTIFEARKKIIDNLVNIYDKNEAQNISEIALEKITGLSKTERIRNKHSLLSSAQSELVGKYINRLLQHEPIQYIINEAWFAGMKFYVDKNVLIPRPETEELADWLIKEFEIQNFLQTEKNKVSKIIDIGTGSGCIAITLKKRIPEAEVWACDVSDKALAIARKNADENNSLIHFVSLNFLDPELRKQLPDVDIIISNPPYVPQKNKNEMKSNVTDYEPDISLFVSDDNPLVFYEAIADFGKEKLNAHGKIYLEIHENFGEEVKALFIKKGYSSIEMRNDMQDKNRMIKISK